MSLKEYSKNYYENNKEVIKKRASEYRAKNKEAIKLIKKLHYEANKQDILNQQKEYRDKNYEKYKEYQNNYHKLNRAKKAEYDKHHKEAANKRKRDRRKNDPVYKLKYNVSNLIRNSITNKKYTKNSKCEIILGCTVTEFKLYLESKFEVWMTWDNYGKYEKDKYNVGWDIDHIIPTSLAQTEDELIKLNHYTNFQPLCSKINRDIKKDTA